jgi:RNA polymerase sigma-70 factor (ECF subfamily)
MAKGDEAAFDRFYERYADRMFRYLVVMTRGDEQLARDVTADAMLRIIRYMKPMESDAALWAWLARVMRTTLVDHLRRSQRNPVQVPLRLDEGAEEEDAVQSTLLMHLENALAALPAEDRNLIEAHYFEGAPQTELAKQTGCTAKAIGMKFTRLRQQLKNYMMKELQRDGSE